MSADSGSTSNGITFVGALQVLFIALKLTGYVDWPWWQVLLPLIINAVVILVLLGVIGVVALYERTH